MKKVCLLLTIFLLLFSFSACTFPCSWEFNHSYEDIVEIKIVDIERIRYPVSKEQFTVIKELDISQAKELCEDIVSLPMKHLGPNPIEPYRNSFLIVFKNGEFDIISLCGSSHYIYNANGTITTDTSYLYSNEEAFSQLMDKYLNT